MIVFLYSILDSLSGNYVEDGREDVLSLIELRLQNLTMILHALDLSLANLELLRSGCGIDILICKHVGRHCDEFYLYGWYLMSRFRL